MAEEHSPKIPEVHTSIGVNEEIVPEQGAPSEHLEFMGADDYRLIREAVENGTMPKRLRAIKEEAARDAAYFARRTAFRGLKRQRTVHNTPRRF